MARVHLGPEDPRVAAALTELETMIRAQFPTATFDVTEGEEPCGVYLDVTVDMDDPDPVMDLVIDRMLEMQIDEHLPVHVVPLSKTEWS